MPDRDYETEFDEIMVGEASRDEDLTEFLNDNIFGDPEGILPLNGSWTEKDLKLRYILNNEMFQTAVANSVANIVGIQTGKELFSE